jgi:asparagine N-glycosylation enzyme membrane subunit Stt3
MLIAAWPGLLLAAIALIRMALTQPADILAGDLYDTDSFTHISRLREILASGDWHQGFFPRDNAPYGMVLHWTMPYDVFCLAIAAPLAAVTGWHQALQILAAGIGPVNIGLLVLAAVFAARPICDCRGRQIVGLTVAAAPIVLQYGQAGDADHHIFIAALWVLALGLLLRLIRGEDRGRLAIVTGLMVALCLWTAVECILVIVLGLGLLGLAWITAGRPLRAASLRTAAALAAGMVAALLIDPPYGGWLRPDLDRLSIVYVTFALFFLLLCLLLAAMPQSPERWPSRLVAGFGGACVAAALLARLFAGILSPERTVFIKDATPDWTATIGEMLPAYHDLRDLVAVCAIPAIGLLYALSMSWRHRGGRLGGNWLAYAVFLLPILAFGLLHIRFMGYPEIAAAPAFAIFIGSLRPSLRRFAPNVHGAVELLVAVALLLLLPAAGSLMRGGVSSEPSAATGAAVAGDCRLRLVASVLQDTGFMAGGRQVLMTNLNLAPEVIYWTDHDVVAGPYHRNVDGIRDEFAFFMSRDDQTAIALLRRRGITHILICPVELRQQLPARTGTGAGAPRNLAERLIDGPAPDWLTLQPWPAGIVSQIRLYRMNSDTLP